MARIACLMMQKNEVLLLKPWLLHHGHLFGFENLFVWDNGSTEPAVLAILAQFKALGVTVDSSHATPAGFADKGNIFTAKIREFREKNRYDVVLPLDCDEFVAIEAQGGISCSRHAILAELARVDWGNLICRTGSGLLNLPGRFDEFQRVGHDKCFAAVRAFEGIDHGFHQAKLPDASHYAATSLVYLHFHYRPHAAFMASARDKLRPWTNPDDLAGLRGYSHVGKHLVRYFYMSEAEYYAVEFAGLPWLKFTGLSDFLAAHMDVAKLVEAWGARDAAPVLPPPADVRQNFEALRAAGLQAMQIDDFAAAARIWAQCRLAFPAEEEGYLYGAVAAKAAGDEALLAQIHAEQEEKFPNVFS
jgi:hypothetical protein